MPSLDSELQEQLAEAGDKLVHPPESVEQLLSLLDQLEGYLSKVEQSPSPPMQIAYSISVKALVHEKLFKHSDIDVRVAVASCISEITRISAPEAPYGDANMKEVFQLIVSSFENLSEKSSRSYPKRSSILATVAKVRSCVVLLDLECDTLILEMFQHFFKEIREYHPEDVFTAMQTIMVLVIEESEDVSPELVSLILTTVKKDNEVPPIVKKLGEKVLQGCASKLEPYLPQLLKSLGVSSNDYCRTVSLICQETTDATNQHDVHLDDRRKLHEEPAEEVATPQQVDAAPDRSPQSVMSTGEVKEERDDSVSNSAPAKKEEHDQESNAVETTKLNHCEIDKRDMEDAAEFESQPEPKRRRGRKLKSSKKPATSANGSRSVKETNGKENNRSKELENEDENDIPSSASEEKTFEDSVQSESDNEAVIRPSPHADEDEPVKDVSPSHSQDLSLMNKPKKGRRGRKKKDNAKEETPVPEISKKASEEMSEEGVETPSGKENEMVNEELSKADDDIDATSDSEAKPIKQPAKKADGDTKRSKKGRIAPEKQVKTFVKEDVDKVGKKRGREENNTDYTPSDQPKKRVPKEDTSNHNEYGEELVSSRIKVWWPMDKAFYEGKITSFDPVKKKHKVSYVDGDVEVLILKKERWKIVSDDDESESAEEHVEDDEEEESPDASPERPERKRGRTKLGRSRKDKIETSSSKKGGVASSNSKQTATGSTRKLKSCEKTENGSDSKLKNNINIKENEAQTPKTAKSKQNEAKSSAKSKPETSKTTKSKHQQQEEEPAASTPKGKASQKGGKSTANGSSGKRRKAGASSTSKTQVSKSGPGKKRRRAV